MFLYQISYIETEFIKIIYRDNSYLETQKSNMYYRGKKAHGIVTYISRSIFKILLIKMFKPVKFLVSDMP